MHSPPPFVPADIRISPSGPYVLPPGGGGIVRFGADAVVETIQPAQNSPNHSPLPRNVAGDPLAVTFPAWRSGDVLWLTWHVGGVMLGGDITTNQVLLEVFPTINTGTGPKLINNASVAALLTLAAAETASVLCAGTCAFKITNPAQPPIVQLFYTIAAVTGAFGSLTIGGVAPPQGPIGPSSAWLCAAELTQEVVFQLPPEVNLLPA